MGIQVAWGLNLTSKERAALLWTLGFLCLGAALKAHQVHATRWGKAFMAPAPALAAGAMPSAAPAGGPAAAAEPPGVVRAVASDSVKTPDTTRTDEDRSRLQPTGEEKNAEGKANRPGSCAIDVNEASLQQLQGLPGVGEKTAERILDYRRQKGRFRKPADLLAVKGIGQKKLDRMRACLIL